MPVAPPSREPRERWHPVRRFFSNLGPGLIAGAADDDPSGISTFSVTGAAFGYAPLWTTLFTFPLMIAVQLMCARLGLVTGRGLGGMVRRTYPRSVLWTACAILLVANTVNIAADLAGMGASMQMITGVPSQIWTLVFTAVIVVLLFLSTYVTIARIFKWLTLVLFAYVIAAFFAHPDWHAVLVSTFVPHLEASARFFAVLVGIFGTSISPYLFFWQAAQEVEEERAMGRTTLAMRKGATPEELHGARNDVVTGMFVSQLVMYFIILTTAATLHRHGVTEIATARDAANALRPLAGQFAYLLFTLGVVGAGMLAVPVLAGSSAYAIAEAGAWRGTLRDRPHASPRFYLVIAVSMLLALALDFAGLDPVRSLFWSAVLNGVLAPPLIVLVVLLTSNSKVMGEHVNPPILKWIGWFTALVMAVCTAAMFVTWAMGVS